MTSSTLGYIAIAIEDKPRLTLEDYVIIFLMFLCIFTAFIMNMIEDFAAGIALWTLSALCMTGAYLFWL